jgi:hypothetical protein
MATNITRDLHGWKPWLLAAVAALLAMAAIAGIAPAKAAACDSIKAVKQGDGSFACVRYNGSTQYLDFCDHDSDNHLVYARFKDRDTGSGYLTTVQVLGSIFGYDRNGASSGCGNMLWSTRIDAIAVCVQTEGCSPFVYFGVPVRVPRR